MSTSRTVVTPRIASWLSEKKCTLHVCRPDYSASENESICLQTKLLSVGKEIYMSAYLPTQSLGPGCRRD
ncbi:hypothetical protein J6590_101377 [Homalodisca vitripennis]|nr:hypothetical protein J6590_101377 [Homalodisca vitripennis]